MHTHCLIIKSLLLIKMYPHDHVLSSLRVPRGKVVLNMKQQGLTSRIIISLADVAVPARKERIIEILVLLTCLMSTHLKCIVVAL